MPRQLRIEYPGAIYLVMDRRDRRENIFVDDVDRHDLIRTLAEAGAKTGWQIHAKKKRQCKTAPMDASSTPARAGGKPQLGI